MIKRTIEVSQQAVHLAVRQRQLLLMPRTVAAGSVGRAESGGDGALTPAKTSRSPLASIPCEDIGILLIDHPAVTYTHAALTALLDQDAAVVLCGGDHLPTGLLLPIGEHSQVVWRIRDQIKATKPAMKRIWQQIIRAKVRAQAANLPPLTRTRSRLLALARQIRSGDPGNTEAHAARAYWSAWRDTLVDPDAPMTARDAAAAFRRDPDGPMPNNLLNYGYAVMRAAVARAIVAAGLLPAIGIRHSARANAFCLADDLVEPLRPMVDAVVAEMVRGGQSELSPESKRPLLELLASECVIGDTTGPLMVALHRYVASFHRCLTGAAVTLDCPVPIREADAERAEAEEPPRP